MPARSPRSSTIGPRLSLQAPRGLERRAEPQLLDGEHREAEHYERTVFDGAELGGITLQECLLEGVSLNDTELRGARFIECSFEDLFAPVFRASRSSWRETALHSTRWGSAELYDSRLDGVHLDGGKLDYVNLRGARLTDVLVSGCIIGELDLSGVTATRVALRDCTVGTLTLDGARLKDVDLRSSSFRGIHGLDGLRGATIDDQQLQLLAPFLAESMGLRVEG
ncbi:pentapeptide repeat-containing protein [Arthrobacter agilis]|uniref:pentapeptide repeat-containing protein n=1 Tax=Arthrobacter agilis TaxID=37921 RepID=UPI0023669857|nr:pentapeptide repeat-containing protein [Arthrobacter agilis]WDF34120.1 pentapeptide repeat-containing protein [Arthrobacter agilis]